MKILLYSKLKIKLSILLSLQIATSLFALLFQAELLSQVSHFPLSILLFFFLCKITTALLELIRIAEKEKLFAQAQSTYWKGIFPMHIPNTQRKKGNAFSQSFLYIGEILRRRGQSLEDRLSFLWIAGFLLFQAQKEEFLLCVFFLVFSSSLALFTEKTSAKRRQKREIKRKQSWKNFFQSLSRYFLSYRELKHNWPAPSFAAQKSASNLGKAFFIQEKEFSKEHAEENFLRIACIDFPHILALSFLLYGLQIGWLSLKTSILWISLLEELIASSSLLRRSLGEETELQGLEELLTSELSPFSMQEEEPPLPSTTAPFFDLSLRNGQKITLGSRTGFFHIKGDNASGKSFFLESLLGLNPKASGIEEEIFFSFRRDFYKKQRLIDREAFFFPGEKDFSRQIFGLHKHSWEKSLYRQMQKALPDKLILQWMKEWKALETLYLESRDSLSAGQRVLLSSARLFSHFPKRKTLLIIADECDSPLDASKRELLLQSLHFLSHKHLVYFVSHWKAEQKPLKSLPFN